MNQENTFVIKLLEQGALVAVANHMVPFDLGTMLFVHLVQSSMVESVV